MATFEDRESLASVRSKINDTIIAVEGLTGFSRVSVEGQGNVDADGKGATLNFEAGDNITITTNASTDTVTISSTASDGVGVTDGEKGDVTVSSSGTVWTVNNDVITNAKLAGMPASTIKGNNVGVGGNPVDLTAAQVKTLLEITASDVSNLATIATSGSATNLITGTVPAAVFNDTSHGARAGGTLHADATTTVAGFMSGADKTKLNGIATNANLYTHPNHTGDVTSIADGVQTITANVVTNAKLAQMASNTLKGNNTGALANALDLTTSQVKTMLAITTADVFGLGTLATQSGTFSGTSSGTNTGDQALFQTIAVSGQSNVVADTTTDTLTLVAGTGTSITTNASTDAITFTNTAPDQTVALTQGGTVTVSGTYPNFTISGAATNLGYTASTRALTSSTGTGVTIPLFSSTDAGLAPASSGGPINFLRADGVWATPKFTGDDIYVVTGASGSGYTSIAAAVTAINARSVAPSFAAPCEILVMTDSLTIPATITLPLHTHIRARNCRVSFTGTGSCFVLSGFNRIYGLELWLSTAGNTSYWFNGGNASDISIIDTHLYGNGVNNRMPFISFSGATWERFNAEHCIINYGGASGYVFSFLNTGTSGRYCDVWLNDIFTDCTFAPSATFTDFGGNVSISGGCADMRINRSTLRGSSTFYTGVRLGSTNDKITIAQCNLCGVPYGAQAGFDIYSAPGSVVEHAYTSTKRTLLTGTVTALFWT